ncbi:MAG: helix-turn-helix transcriptional regulator [Firmicutes bacterium]|nr:helix-turn-helix transcriptional regulator [Bacillota bacterium]
MMSEKIRLVLAKKNKSKSWLAEQLNWSASNLYNKFKRDNFSEKELVEIARVLDCTFEASFVLNDSGERF